MMPWLWSIAAFASYGQPAPPVTSLAVAPGETVLIEPVGITGAFRELRREPSIEKDPETPAGAIRFTMSRERGATWLVVDNQTKYDLRYRAGIQRGGRLAPTSTCNVGPGLGAFEHWRNPIGRLVLHDLRLQPISSPQQTFTIACR
jgi:hypothetical protein